ncbi:MAG: D-2-hydroxyacid dehydrogenase [Ruthenibacterium sp.]
MKAVILDSYALQEGDLDWSPVAQMVDELVQYPRTKPQEIIPRLCDADLVIMNNACINEEVLRACPRLKWVGVTATGVDLLDLAACRRHGVGVANVPAYSTQSVAQMTFALLLELCQSAGRYDAAVRQGHWQLKIPAACGILPHKELCGKTLGLVGYGAIAQQVGTLARAFGMRVLCHTRTQRPEYAQQAVTFLPLSELLADSDVVSLHCPSTPETRGMLNAQSLALCKRGVLILNTARGLLVDEKAMADALRAGQVGGYAADVASAEPIAPDNLLLSAPRVLLTPHIAWATPEALVRLANTVAENLRSFLAGGVQNIVN